MPSAGDRLWLVWRSFPNAVPLLLGAGRIRVTDEGQAFWTNRTLPRVRQAARDLGYRGPTNMKFLRLTEVVSPQGQPPVDIGQISPGLNVVNPQQSQLLTGILPIR